MFNKHKLLIKIAIFSVLVVGIPYLALGQQFLQLTADNQTLKLSYIRIWNYKQHKPLNLNSYQLTLSCFSPTTFYLSDLKIGFRWTILFNWPSAKLTVSGPLREDLLQEAKFKFNLKILLSK